MPQLDTSTWPTQLIWLAITFFALYFIMARLVIPRTGGVIALRKAAIEGDLAAAQKLKAETDQAMQDYEAALADARNRAQSIARDNRDKLTAEVDAERAKLDAELGVRMAAAEKSVNEAKAKALSGIEAVAAEIAASIVSELTGAKVTNAAVAEAVAKAAK